MIKEIKFITNRPNKPYQLNRRDRPKGVAIFIKIVIENRVYAFFGKFKGLLVPKKWKE